MTKPLPRLALAERISPKPNIIDLESYNLCLN